MTRTELLQIAKPILFNTEMVRAILDGRKTVTRRVVNPRYCEDEFGFNVITNAKTGEFVRLEKMNENGGGIFSDGSERYITQPAYKGDILYARETWCALPVTPGGHTRGHDVYYYKADGDLRPEAWRGNWHPSIHMPKGAARLFLRVTDVRVERLQDITPLDCELEGAFTVHTPILRYDKKTYLKVSHDFMRRLWDSTIKPVELRTYGWDANPWVWVIEFDLIYRSWV